MFYTMMNTTQENTLMACKVVTLNRSDIAVTKIEIVE